MRIRFLVILSILIFQLSPGFAQLGNEWINYSWDYYKIQLDQDGIYQLSYDDLVNAGFPVSTVNPRRIKLFHRGNEQAIFISGENDSQLNPGDFIEFYGIRNNGELDSLLYEPFSSQPHPYYNLYSDSSAYFLTWDKSNLTNGKRMDFYQENNPGNVIPTEPFHRNENLQLQTSDYSLGIILGDYVSRSSFIEGEGWTGARIQEGSSQDFTITDLTARYTTGDNPSIQMIFAGRNSLNHDIEISVGPDAGNLRSLTSFIFAGYLNYYLDEEILWTDIGANGELLIRVSVLSNGSPLSNISVSSIQTIFPQTFDMENKVSKYFFLEPNPSGKSYVSIQNTPTNPVFYDVTDRDNVIRVGFSGNTNEIEAVIRNTNVSRTLFARTPSFLTPSIKRVRLKSVDPVRAEYIIISHPDLMKPVENINDAVEEYANYRASVQGGSYDTLVMSIRDIYDQFSYGEVSSLSIRNFMKWIVQNSGNPEFLFIIGKGLEIRYNYYRRDPLSFAYGELVPIAGMPASDALYTQGLSGNTFEPGVPTGRLTANSPQDVINYLNKIKEKESVPYDDFWQKRLLHLSGGREEFELALFENYVKGFEAIASDEFYGGRAKTISKNTASAIEFVDISEEINNGVNIVTFFGHSAPGIIDIDVGVPSNPIYGYDNKGLYPTFFVNGCQSGDFFDDNINWGADWILTPDLGAVTFIAHTYFGFSATLKRFNDVFYEIGFADSTFIKRTIGEIHQETGRTFLENSSSGDVNINQVQQMILIGDPATRLFGTNISDYATDDFKVFAIPVEGEERVTSSSSSFDLGIIVENYGAAFNDSLEVAVTRILPNTATLFLDTLKFPAPFFSDTLLYPIDNTNLSVEGLNRFTITLNPRQQLVELDYNNNLANFPLLIPAGATTNLFPIEYAFIPNENISLTTQSSDILGDQRIFDLQIDTVTNYSSPIFQSNSVNARFLATWEPQIAVPAGDTITYYWRSKFGDPLPGEVDEWNNSSFSVSNNAQEGWAQLQFEQFLESSFENIVTDTIQKKFDFPETQTQVFVKTFGSENPDFGSTDVELEINNVPYLIERFCRDNTLNLIAFDKSTTLPYAALFEGVNSPRTCGRQVQVINNYTTAEINGTGDYLNNYIDAVGNGDQVILFSIGIVEFDTWNSATLNNLTTLGIDPSIFGTDIQPGDPFIIVGRKGDTPGSEEVVIADTPPANEQVITLNRQILGKKSSGKISSTVIGPSLRWESLEFEVNLVGDDKVNLEVIGLNSSGETTLFSGLQPGSQDLSGLDASLYPSLKLSATLEDTSDLTTPQLNKWIVLYESPGEGILLFEGNDRNNALNINLIEGESFTTDFQFINVSNKSLGDSLYVSSSIFNYASSSPTESNFNIKSPSPGDTTRFSFDIISNGLIGNNDFSITVNADNAVPEIKLSNNRILFENYFNVEEDDVNPVIDVVFDGQQIFDGDIVSPTPLIAIEITDENEFLLKEDTTGIDLFITYPNEDVARRVNFTESAISWSPANQNSPFKINYSPEFNDNGIYSLSVQARDASGNKAGTEPYQISFEVINESTITNFYPYPNPFSSSTRFVFTLTGRNIPDEMKIQIMTISGKIVREITQDEIGLIRIGNNQTEFAWDGKDEYGDQLANGVYLYRVLARIAGQPIDHRESAGDKGFTKGFGKLYLLR